MVNRREKREFYEELLERKKRDGLSYRELAEQSGIPKTRLAWWGQKLARERPEVENGFVELVQAPDPVQEGDGYEIVLANDRWIRIPTGFDDGELRRLIAVLEGTC